MGNLLDVIMPPSEDDIGEGTHLCITHESLLKCFLLVCRQVGVMKGNVKWDVGARTWTEVREGIRQDHFLTGAVMDDVVISLEAQ